MALARFQAHIQDEDGNVIPSANVYVQKETGGLVQLFADREGTTALGNPFLADANGYFFFHAVGAAGGYKITANSGSSSRIWRNVAVGTAQEYDVSNLISEGNNYLIQQVSAGYGLNYVTTTTSPPANGEIRFNNANLALATSAYVSIYNVGNSLIEDRLLELFSSLRSRKDAFYITTGNKQSSFNITNAVDSGDYVTLTVANQNGTTSFSNGVVTFIRELAGPDGTVTNPVTGNINPVSNTGPQFVGNTIARWAIVANGADFSGNVTIAGTLTLPGGGTITGAPIISGLQPTFIFHESDGSTNGKYWRWYVSAESMRLDLLNDAQGFSDSFVDFNRSGTTAVSSVWYQNTVPSTNGIQLGNTINQWALLATTGRFADNVTFTSNALAVGNTIGRPTITANSADFSSTVNVTGLTTLATGNVTSTLQLRGNTTLFANVTATTNAAVIQVGNTIGRVLMFANNVDLSGNITFTSNALAIGTTTGRPSIVANTIGVSNGAVGTPSFFFNEDTNSGVYSSAADSVTIVTGGANNIIANTTQVTLNQPIQARVAISTETTGTLTIASANKQIFATGTITINDGIFSQGDSIVIYAGSSSRSIAQDTGMTLRLHGSETTGSRTLAARGVAGVIFISGTEAVVTGDVT